MANQPVVLNGKMPRMQPHKVFVFSIAFVSALLAVALIACSVPNTVAPPTPTETVPDLPNLSLATAISIQDDWSGLSAAAPVVARIRLERIDDQFVGTATYSAGGFSSLTLSTTETVTVPLSVFNDFVQTLSSARLETGPYIIPPTRTDYYPRVSLQIEFTQGQITFFSDSQNDDHSPWLLTLFRTREGYDKFVIHSDVPTRALNTLNPYLKREVQQSLIESARSAK
ncbi:MAG: hypothetical protein HY870_04500 [Chloroflexi bacterium]|nr:hypothetical protein [Chloroflexota bacterium]